MSDDRAWPTQRAGLVDWMRAVFGTSRDSAMEHVHRALLHLSLQPGPGRTEKGEDGRYRYATGNSPDGKPRLERT